MEYDIEITLLSITPDSQTLLEKAGREQDEDASLALYREAEQKLVDDAAAIPLYFDRSFTLVKPYIEGYSLNPLGYLMLNNVSITPH